MDQNWGAVNQLVSFADGFTLVSGHRRDRFIRIWDSRKDTEPVLVLPRLSETSQCLKMTKFTYKSVIAGDDTGCLNIYSVERCLERVMKTHEDAVTFVAVDHNNPKSVFSASGSRSMTGAACAKFSQIPGE